MLCVPLDLSPASRVVRLAVVDGPDVILGQLGLELLRDELFAVIEIHLSRNPSLLEGAPQCIYRLLCTLVPIRSRFHPEARAIIGEAGDVDLPLARYAELEGVSLPHRVDVVSLEPLRWRLGLWI